MNNKKMLRTLVASRMMRTVACATNTASSSLGVEFNPQKFPVTKTSDHNNNNPQRWLLCMSNIPKHFAPGSVPMLFEPKRMNSTNATTTTTTASTTTTAMDDDDDLQKQLHQQKMLGIYKELEETAKFTIRNQVHFDTLAAIVVASVNKKAKNTPSTSDTTAAAPPTSFGKWLYDWFAENGKKNGPLLFFDTLSQLLVEPDRGDEEILIEIIDSNLFSNLHFAISRHLAGPKTLVELVEERRNAIFNDGQIS